MSLFKKRKAAVQPIPDPFTAQVRKRSASMIVQNISFGMQSLYARSRMLLDFLHGMGKRRIQKS